MRYYKKDVFHNYSGLPHDQSNYRGVSLLCYLSKIFTKLNNRLVMWADENNVRHKEQAGYFTELEYC